MLIDRRFTGFFAMDRTNFRQLCTRHPIPRWAERPAAIRLIAGFIVVVLSFWIGCSKADTEHQLEAQAAAIEQALADLEETMILFQDSTFLTDRYLRRQRTLQEQQDMLNKRLESGRLVTATTYVINDCAPSAEDARRKPLLEQMAQRLQLRRDRLKTGLRASAPGQRLMLEYELALIELQLAQAEHELLALRFGFPPMRFPPMRNDS